METWVLKGEGVLRVNQVSTLIYIHILEDTVFTFCSGMFHGP